MSCQKRPGNQQSPTLFYGVGIRILILKNCGILALVCLGVHILPLFLIFVEHGGYTLCGLHIPSGQDMYGPRWNVFSDTLGIGKADPALLDLHGVSCMVCRRKLMYGVSRIIKRLTALRDSVGEEYVQKVPLIHGKEVLSHQSEGSTTSETYRLHCDVAANEINPRLLDAAREFGRITCPVCIANFKTDTIED